MTSIELSCLAADGFRPLLVNNPPSPAMAAPNSSYGSALPAGWAAVESKSRPGEVYFVGPKGPTWKAPTPGYVAPTQSTAATSSAAAARQPRQPRGPAAGAAAKRASSCKSSNSSYRSNYVRWSKADTLAAQREKEEYGFSPSVRLHPKAADPSRSRFVSESRANFVKHDIAAAPASHQWVVPGKMAPLGETSEYLAEYAPWPFARPASARARTPPKSSKFIHNSTSRADFRGVQPGDASEGEAAGKVPAPPSRPKELSNAVTRNPKSDAIGSLVLTYSSQPPKKPAAAADGSSRPNTAKLYRRSAFGASEAMTDLFTEGGSKATPKSLYGADFTEMRLPSRDDRSVARKHERNAWPRGMNKSDPGAFQSIVRRDYRGEGADVVSPWVMQTCRRVDASSKARSTVHSELGVESV
jgi:hypothetical protein